MTDKPVIPNPVAAIEEAEGQPLAAVCSVCKVEIDTANVEVFELTGDLFCDDCADAAFAGMADLEDEPS
jgi:hypothetical protein